MSVVQETAKNSIQMVDVILSLSIGLNVGNESVAIEACMADEPTTGEIATAVSIRLSIVAASDCLICRKKNLLELRSDGARRHEFDNQILEACLIGSVESDVERVEEFNGVGSSEVVGGAVVSRNVDCDVEMLEVLSRIDSVAV